MSFLSTKAESNLVKAAKPCVGGVMCGGQAGMNQAPIHAVNPRDPGGLGFM